MFHSFYRQLVDLYLQKERFADSLYMLLPHTTVLSYIEPISNGCTNFPNDGVGIAQADALCHGQQILTGEVIWLAVQR